MKVRAIIIEFIPYFLATLGMLLLAGAMYSYANTQYFIATSIHARGVVIDIRPPHRLDVSEGYYLITRFHDSDGKEHLLSRRIETSPPRHAIGEEAAILYPPGEPGKARLAGVDELDEHQGAAIVWSIFGAVFFAIGGGMSAVSWWRYRNSEKYLQRNGKRIFAMFRSVVRDEGAMADGRGPWRIVVQWQDPATAEMRVFNSPDIRFDPTKLIKQEKILVLIDPRDRNRYRVDISFLPTECHQGRRPMALP
jgi:hypothetical protein